MPRTLLGRKVWSGVAAALVMMFLSPIAQATLPCAARDEIVGELSQRFNEVPEANGVTPEGLLVEVFVSEKRSWTILITTPQGLACIAAVGENWEREYRRHEVGF